MGRHRDPPKQTTRETLLHFKLVAPDKLFDFFVADPNLLICFNVRQRQICLIEDDLVSPSRSSMVLISPVIM